MEVEEEHVHTLLSMGFLESEIRRALRRAKNDLNEAVAYLTNDQTLPNDWEEVDRIDDVEMKDIHPRSSQTMYSPDPPPSYDEVHAMDVSIVSSTCIAVFALYCRFYVNCCRFYVISQFTTLKLMAILTSSVKRTVVTCM